MLFNLLYIDPGSGSYLIQIIIAAILGFSFFIKNFWIIIKAFFTGEKTVENEENIKEHDA